VSTDETRRSSLPDDDRAADGPEVAVDIGDAGDVLATCERDGVSMVASVGPAADRDAVESAIAAVRDELAYYAGGNDD
jgi:hypothetical protein